MPVPPEHLPGWQELEASPLGLEEQRQREPWPWGKVPPQQGTHRACLFVLVEASEMESKEGRPGGWVPQLLRKLWLDWFPAPDIPKTQNHE